MKVSEMISILSKMKDLHGDIDVVLEDSDGFEMTTQLDKIYLSKTAATNTHSERKVIAIDISL